MPLISVVMSVYNAEPYLKQAIESILGQSYRNFEFIIVNDGSTDSSLDIINKYMMADKRIRLIKLVSNLGAYESLNYGIKKASGELIFRQDADDISQQLRMQKQLSYFKAHKDIVCLGTLVRCISDDPRNYTNGTVAAQEKWSNTYTTPEELYRTRFMRCPMLHATAMFRKEDCLKVGGYDQQYFTGGDYDFLLKMSTLGKLAKYPEKLYIYRIIDKSLYHSNKNINLINTIKIRFKWIRHYFENNNRTFNSIYIVCDSSLFDFMIEAASQMDVKIEAFVCKCDIKVYKDIKILNINELSNAPRADSILIRSWNASNIIKELESYGFMNMKDFINITA